MANLKLFRSDIDPLRADAIPFPNLRSSNHFELRLTDQDRPVDAIAQVEDALEEADNRLNSMHALFAANDWFDDDGPRAA